MTNLARFTSVGGPQWRHILVRGLSALHRICNCHSIVAVACIMMTLMDIASLASTDITAASVSLTFILLLRPATLYRATRPATVSALIGLTLGTEDLRCVISFHRCCRRGRHLPGFRIDVVVKGMLEKGFHIS